MANNFDYSPALNTAYELLKSRKGPFEGITDAAMHLLNFRDCCASHMSLEQVAMTLNYQAIDGDFELLVEFTKLVDRASKLDEKELSEVKNGTHKVLDELGWNTVFINEEAMYA